MIELSIVIVSYNVKDFLQECVHAIFNHLKKIEFEIIVVDNFSQDGSIAMLEKNFPSVKIISNNFNNGFSPANNQGMEIASGKYFFLLNPDTFFLDDSFYEMFSFIKNSKTDCIVAPKLLNADKSLQYSAWKDKTLFVLLQETFRIFKSFYPLEKFHEPMEVENVAGAAMLFPKTLVEHIGNLDDNLFWMEDFDFCYRARQHGKKVFYFPATSILHHGGESTNQNPGIMYANDNISKLKFYKKHKSPFQIFIAGFLILMHFFGYTFFLLLMSPFNKNYRKKLLRYFYATGKFLRYLSGKKNSIA